MPQLQGLSHCGPHTPGAHAVRRGGGRGSPRGSTCSPQSTRLCPLSPRTPAGGLWPKPCTPYLAKAAGCSGVLVGDRPGSQAPRAGAEGVPGPATHRWSSRHLARLAHTGTGRAPRSGRGHTPGHKALGQRGRGDEAPAPLTPHRHHPPRPAPAPFPHQGPARPRASHRTEGALCPQGQGGGAGRREGGGAPGPRMRRRGRRGTHGHRRRCCSRRSLGSSAGAFGGPSSPPGGTRSCRPPWGGRRGPQCP